MNRPLATELFEAMTKYFGLEYDAYEALLLCCGFNPDDVDAWPCSDFTFDYYDTSFEFKGTKPGWVPTQEQLNACFDLGFSRCWFCYTDGTEKCFGDGRKIPGYAPGQPPQGVAATP